MPAIVFHTDAAEEMQATAAYYAGRAPGLGEAFLDESSRAYGGFRNFRGCGRSTKAHIGAIFCSAFRIV
jgi:hypothetical protein